MKRAHLILLTVAVGRVLLAADAVPTGEAILEKYLEVTGGRNAYAKVQTQVTNAVLEFVGKGVKANMTMYHAAPLKAYIVTEIEGIGKMEEGTDGSIVWERSAIKGPRIKTGEERTVSLRGADLQHDIHWRNYFNSVESTGVEPVNGRICYRVVLTPKEGQPETRYYDKETHLLVKTSMIMSTEMGAVPVESYTSDYRMVEGVLTPFEVTQKVLGQEMTVKLQTIKSNVKLPDDRFAVPDDVKALAQPQPK